MTPQEQSDLDSVKQELRTTERLLADTKGRVKAVELDSYEIKRNAKLATEAAEALKAETEASLLTAAEQMKTAHSVACGIFGMAELGRAFMARKTAAARMTHREAKLCELLQQFVDASTKADVALSKAATDRAKQVIASIKSDGEVNRNKAHEYALAYGYKTFEAIFNELVREENA